MRLLLMSSQFLSQFDDKSANALMRGDADHYGRTPVASSLVLMAALRDRGIDLIALPDVITA